MGMFLNYQNIADNYTPNNLICSFPVGKSYTKLDPINSSKPFEEYNLKGELIGYFWHYGETLNLEFNIDGEIIVEEDSLMLYKSGEEPSTKEGKLYQRAYNVADMKSWTCTSISDTVCIWTPDKEFTYATSGKSVYVSAQDYLKDKHVELKLFNFRMEEIYSKIFEGSTKIILPVNKELSSKLFKGIYYCSLTVFDDKIQLPIFSSHDCTLLVK